MTTAVMGDFANSTLAHQAVSHLRKAGVPPDDISVIIEEPQVDPARDRNTGDVTSGAVTGGMTGAILGGLTGWILSLGLWDLFGVGRLAAENAAGATFAGAAAGAALLGLLGAIAGLSFNSDPRSSVNDEGDVLVTVLARAIPVERIESLMRENDALNVQRTDDLPAQQAPLTSEPTAFERSEHQAVAGTPMVQAGQSVFTLDDDRLGEVAEAHGDFFTVKRGFLHSDLYIPFEDVHDIRPDRVYVNAVRDEVELKAWDAEPSHD